MCIKIKKKKKLFIIIHLDKYYELQAYYRTWSSNKLNPSKGSFSTIFFFFFFFFF